MSTPENIAIASLRNLYRIKAFRLGFKFSVNLFILKAIDDAFHYMIYGNYMKLPRYVMLTLNLVLSLRSPAPTKPSLINTLSI